MELEEHYILDPLTGEYKVDEASVANAKAQVEANRGEGAATKATGVGKRPSRKKTFDR